LSSVCYCAFDFDKYKQAVEKYKKDLSEFRKQEPYYPTIDLNTLTSTSSKYSEIIILPNGDLSICIDNNINTDGVIIPSNNAKKLSKFLNYVYLDNEEKLK